MFKIIREIPKYCAIESYGNIIKRLVAASDSGSMYDFFLFEIAFAEAKKERDSYSLEERKFFYETFNTGRLPREIFMGGYLDELEKIVLEVNIAIGKRRKNIMDDWVPRSEGKMDMDIIELCSEGINNYREFFEKSIKESRVVTQ